LPAAPPYQAGDVDQPSRQQRAALRELVALGYYRGILNQLDDIERLSPQCSAFAADMRDLARQFQFETMLQRLSSDINES
jgi:hypothetical protein